MSEIDSTVPSDVPSQVLKVVCCVLTYVGLVSWLSKKEYHSSRKVGRTNLIRGRCAA